MADGTHKTVEDDLITDAVMVTKPCTAEDYPSVKELILGAIFGSLFVKIAGLLR